MILMKQVGPSHILPMWFVRANVKMISDSAVGLVFSVVTYGMLNCISSEIIEPNFL